MNKDLLRRTIRKSCHCVTKDEIIAGNKKRFSRLGLDEHDIHVMADAVGLEVEDLLLLDCSVSSVSKTKPSKPGTPGRKNETFDIGAFAKERRDREPQMTWNEICRDWIRTYPDDKRVTSKEIVRDAYRRSFGDKSRDRKQTFQKP